MSIRLLTLSFKLKKHWLLLTFYRMVEVSQKYLIFITSSYVDAGGTNVSVAVAQYFVQSFDAVNKLEAKFEDCGFIHRFLLPNKKLSDTLAWA